MKRDEIDELRRITVELANDIEHVCAGKPSGAVYLAIAQVLGLMESLATKEPDREYLFSLLSMEMDSYIRKIAN